MRRALSLIPIVVMILACASDSSAPAPAPPPAAGPPHGSSSGGSGSSGGGSSDGGSSDGGGSSGQDSGAGGNLSCDPDECLGTNGLCYGPCASGSSCTTTPSGDCSQPSAGGVYCCNTSGSGYQPTGGGNATCECGYGGGNGAGPVPLGSLCAKGMVACPDITVVDPSAPVSDPSRYATDCCPPAPDGYAYVYPNNLNSAVICPNGQCPPSLAHYNGGNGGLCWDTLPDACAWCSLPGSNCNSGTSAPGCPLQCVIPGTQ
jgi:hypothetical protein